jgi:Flp pilus assembly protein TadG
MPRPPRADFRQPRRADGQALIVYAAVVPLFFAVALFAVDGSRLFVGKQQMQNAADAAALAAARELNDTDTPCTAVCEINVRALAS